jgi:lysophospholipid hydrolase
VPSNLNLKTVAILPSSRNVPVAAFAKRLRTALEDIGASTAYLDQATVTRHLGRHTFSTMGKLKVAGWLSSNSATRSSSTLPTPPSRASGR